MGNPLQVINLYEASSVHATHFDVTILVNGLPRVHLERKRRGVDAREVFNKTNRYQRHTFWARPRPRRVLNGIDAAAVSAMTGASVPPSSTTSAAFP